MASRLVTVDKRAVRINGKWRKMCLSAVLYEKLGRAEEKNVCSKKLNYSSSDFIPAPG